MDKKEYLDDLDLLDAELEELGAYDDLDLGIDPDLSSAPAYKAAAETIQPTETKSVEPIPEDDFDEPEFDDDFDEPLSESVSPVKESYSNASDDFGFSPENPVRPGQNGSAKQVRQPKATAAKKPSTGPKSEKQDFDPKKIAMGVVILLLLVLCVILLCRSCNCGSCGKNDRVMLGAEDFFDKDAKEGFLPSMTEEEIQAELNRIVEEGMFNVSIGFVMEFETSEDKALANIENIPANRYYMSVDITLDDTGETVYSSKGIKPGQYIDYISLNKKLEAGEYPATARFTAYQPDTYAVEGHVAVKVTIYVKK